MLRTLTKPLAEGGRLCRILFLLGPALFFGLIAQAASASWNYTTTTGTLGTTYNWIDCSGGSSIVSLDDAQATIAWPFNFEFYGDSYTTSNLLSVCTNGYIRLDGTANTSYTDASSYELNTSSTGFGQIIAMGLYDGNVSDIGSWVRSTVTGTAPYRIFTIEYQNLEINWNSNLYADIQVQFHETSNKVVLLFGSDNVSQSGADLGIHSGVSNYFHKWQEVSSGTNNRWIEYSPPPILVTATSGTSKARYFTLKAAFDAINAGTHANAVTINVLGSTSETATATLNASGQASTNYTDLTIYPIVPGATIGGSVDGPLIYLNGADNVTVDGRLNATGSSSALTLNNASNGWNAVTLQLNNGASHNIVTYCTIKGGGNSNGTNGTVSFLSSGSNSFNALTNNALTNNGSRRPVALYVEGWTNTNNVVSNNAFFDTWSATATSRSIYFNSWETGVSAPTNSAWNLTGNNFYETTTLVPNGAYEYSGIYIYNQSGQGGYTLSNNYIGGRAPQCGGAVMTVGTTSSLKDIALTPICIRAGTTVNSSIQGNIIRNLTVKSSGSTPFTGVKVSGAAVQIGSEVGNFIGDTIGTGSLVLTSSATSATSYGILCEYQPGSIAIHNNGIGSVTAENTNPANAHSFYGIRKFSPDSITVKDNTIGGISTPRSIQCTSTATGNNQFLVGIYSSGKSGESYTDNVIANLYNGTTRNDAGAYVAGIQPSGEAATTVAANFIYGLSCASTGTANIVAGIYSYHWGAGPLSAYNNVISLGEGLDGKNYTICGILSKSGASETYLHNTVYIYGTTTGTNANSVAFYKDGWSTDINLSGNLLINDRSGGTGTGKHMAIALNTTSGVVSNNNDLYVSGTNSALGWAYNATTYTTDTYTTLSSWQTGASLDATSLSADPVFEEEGGAYAEAYIPTEVLTATNSEGTTTTDYDGSERPAEPTIGAWELAALNTVEVYQNGIYKASFRRLKLAFDKINDGTYTGNLTVKLIGNSSENATAALNASGSGSASYTRVLVHPTIANLTVTGNLDAPLITFNGADNVTLDGRVDATGSEPSLTLTNTSTSASAVTVLFNNSTQQDTLRYCYVRGGGGSSTNGTIHFGASGINTANMVERCHITNNGTRRVNAVYAAGGTNTGHILLHNKLYDTWSTTTTSYGVNLGLGTSGWVLSGNSLYETTSFTPGGNYTYYGINLSNTSGHGFQLSGNAIGGQDMLCLGSPLQIGVSGTLRGLAFIPIYINTGTTTPTLLHGNIIRNLAIRSSATSPFFGIYLNNGSLDVGALAGNSIGDTVGIGSIQLTSTATSATSYGIYAVNTASTVIANNTIGSITTSSTNNANAHSFHAIYKGPTTGTLTIRNNYIGSPSKPESVLVSSSATGQSQTVYGIFSEGTDLVLIQGNTVGNVYNATTETTLSSKTYGIYVLSGRSRIIGNNIHDLTSNGSANGANYTNVSMTGIHVYASAYPHYIVQNQVGRLTSNTTSQVEFYGIYMTPSSSGNDTVAGNFVKGFKMLSESTTCYLHGISIHNTTGTFTGSLSAFNNIVFMGDSISKGCNIFGILKNTPKAFNLYHNTIHLGGVVSDGSTTTSYALRERTDGTPAQRDIRNNVFYNTRSGGGSNYALYLHGSSNLTIDYNDYGWSGTYFATINSGNLVTLQQWLETMAGQDTHSLILDPQFVNMGGVLPVDYKTNIGLDGIPGTGVSTDFGGLTRSAGSPTMGAWECFPVDVLNGSTYRSSYFTLKDAFDAINAGTWTGDLTIKLKGSTLETATAQLNASGTGSANYSSVLIHPIRSNVVVRGNLNGDIIRLNGADNVTFDGRVNTVGTTIDLTLTNLNTGSSANTVRLGESATQNKIQYCLLSGAGSGTSSAILHISTASTGEGNDNNIINNNRFTGLSTTLRPYNALLSQGTTGRTNSDNFVSNNTFVDTWRQASSANMVMLGAGSDYWMLTGNHFYETTAFTPTGAYIYSAVNLNNTAGGGHIVADNFVGGTLEQGLGNTMNVGVTSAAASFTAFQVNVGTDSVSSLQGNTVTNLNVVSASNQPFAAFYVTGGSVNLGTERGNIIGAMAGNGKIIVTSAASNASSAGIYVGGGGDVAVSNNTLGGITVTSSAGYAHNFYGIYGTGNAQLTVSDNTVGSNTTTQSVQTTSAATSQAQRLDALRYEGTGKWIVERNTVSNLYNASTYNNTGNQVVGIYKTGTGSAQIKGNFVDRLSLASASVSPSISGIWLQNGSSTCVNNVISLGGNITGYNLIYGIYELGVTDFSDTIAHNTVYLSGTVNGTGSQALTYAFIKYSDVGASYLLNNILYNARTGGNTSSRHYAISLSGISSLSAINGNDYYVPGGTNMLGRLGASNYTTVAAWRLATSKDAASISSNPGLLNAGGNSPLDYKTGGLLDGIPAGVLTDFGASERSMTAPTIGAWEYFLCVEIWTNNTKREAYTTLKSAFDDINSSAWTGDITVKILKSTYETATASLLASGSGPSYSRVRVYATRENIAVAGSMNAPLVLLQGADRVTIDGRVNAIGSTPGLTFTNISTGTNASTIKLAESAQQDTLQYCILKGAGQGTATGLVHLGTSSTGTGNVGNVVRYNQITGLNSSERPLNAVYSAGTVGRTNNATQIVDNAFFDLLIPGVSSNVIYLSTNTTDFTVSGNSIYNTLTQSVPVACEYALIRIDNTTGQGFQVINNFLGGQAPGAVGTWSKIGQATTFYGVYLNVSTATATSLQGNTFRGFNFNNTGAADMVGVHVAGGTVNVGSTTGNVFGAPTGTGSITLTNSGSDAAFYGVRIQGSGTVTCNNNTVGSVTAANSTPANATNIYGISKAAVSGNLTVSNNVIGSSTTPNSVQATSEAYNTNQLVYGLYSLGTGTNVFSGNTLANIGNKTVETIKASKLVGMYIGAGSNTIQNNTLINLTSGGSANGAQGANAPVIGLLLSTTTAGQQVTGNTISKMQNTSTAKVYVYGLYYAGPTSGTNVLATNFINRMLLPLAPPESVVYGMSMQQGTASVYNNIIAIGDSLAKGMTLYGLQNASNSTLTIFHNTLYIGGTVAAASSSTYAFGNESTGTHTIRNNIMANHRSGGGKHYAILLTGTSGLTINYNDYWAGGVNGILGRLSTDRSTIAAWRSATGQDLNSLNLNPDFILPGSTMPVDYTPTVTLDALAGLVNIDYVGTVRATPPTMGALEFSGYYWTGTLDTDWSKPGNWMPHYVPTSLIRANIPQRINQPLINNGVQAAASTLVIYAGAVVTINGGGALTVASNVVNNAGETGLVINSTASGTGSFICNQDGIYATVRRYINGEMATDTAAWHLLSTPVAAQPIQGTVWTPAGQYGDGTAYDLFVWDEPSASWIYNLNTTTPDYTTWTVAHPSATFVPGRGYLYSLYDSIATPAFSGYLNNGLVNYALTKDGAGSQSGFHLVGNPYPSSIDWKAASGLTRTALDATSGGYDLWMWSSISNNYGVYNSIEPDDLGTLSASRYIAPMQGFFVKAASAGQLGFANEARVHESASAWLRSSDATASGAVRLTVASLDGLGKDEVKLSFGFSTNDKGTGKLFSYVQTAPSLYLPLRNQPYTIRRMTTPEANGKTPVAFKPGVEGRYTLQVRFDAALTNTVILEDKLTGTFHDFAEFPVYTFTAASSNPVNRFVLHYGSIQPEDKPSLADIFVKGENLVVDLNKLKDDYTLMVYDLSGRVLKRHSMFGGERFELSLKQRGVYIVSLRSETAKYDVKVVY